MVRNNGKRFISKYQHDLDLSAYALLVGANFTGNVSAPSIKINTLIDDLVSKLIVNGQISFTRGVINNTSGTQLEIWGWNNEQGSAATAGEIRIGGTAAYQGRIFYKSAGNTSLNFDNTFDDNNSEINFRTKSFSTPFNILTLKQSLSRFFNQLEASSFVKTGGSSNELMCADGSVKNFQSGIYTPTLTNTSNIISSSVQPATWVRINDIVTVYITASAATSAASQTELTFTLPVGTNSPITLTGSGQDTNPFCVRTGNGSTNTIGARWNSSGAHTSTIYITFQYQLT